MAKQGRMQRELKLKNRTEACKSSRAALNARLLELEAKKRSSSDEKEAMSLTREIFKIMNYLQRTRSVSYIRARNRCQITGRTRGYLGVFGMCRGVVRSLAAFGLLNGVKKSSHS